MQIEKSTPSFPLELFVSQDAVGVPGLTPTVAIRDTVSGYYFDFDDDTFKSSGWVTKFGPMIDVGGGRYQRMLSVQSIASITAGLLLSLEYHFDDGSGIVGDATDLAEVVTLQRDLAATRKVLTNRKKETSGNPGTLTIYDDDGTTVFLTGDLKDESGGAVTPVVGSPAEFVPQ